MQSNWCLTPSADRGRVSKGGLRACCIGKLKKKGLQMQSDAFWGLQQQENQGQFKAACLQFFLWKSTQFTRILVESSNVHFFFKTLVYMQSVTLIPRYFIQKYYLTMSNEKSFGEFIDNTISKRQIVIHQRAFIYDKLLFSFPFWPSEKFKIKGKDGFFIFNAIKVTDTLEKSSQRNRRSPALLENTGFL